MKKLTKKDKISVIANSSEIKNALRLMYVLKQDIKAKRFVSMPFKIEENNYMLILLKIKNDKTRTLSKH